jgi:AcrR family transcriptional regulator
MSQINRKEKILETALICFNKKGYYKTSINMIARQARISKGGLYYHFASKEKLFIELFYFNLTRYFEKLKKYVKEEKDPVRKIHVLAEMSGKILRDNQVFFRFVLEFLSVGIREANIRKGMNAFYQNMLTYYAGLVEKGIETGALKKMNAKETARAMYFLFIGTFFTYFSIDADFDLIKQEMFNIDALMRGIQN